MVGGLKLYTHIEYNSVINQVKLQNMQELSSTRYICGSQCKKNTTYNKKHLLQRDLSSMHNSGVATVLKLRGHNQGP